MRLSLPLILIQKSICFLFLTTIGMQSGMAQSDDSQVALGGNLLNINTKIDSLMTAADCNMYILFLTTKFNFRDFLVDDYKANRANTEPNSSPITPAPTRTIFFGISLMFRASVDVTTRVPS